MARYVPLSLCEGASNGGKIRHKPISITGRRMVHTLATALIVFLEPLAILWPGRIVLDINPRRCSDALGSDW